MRRSALAALCLAALVASSASAAEDCEYGPWSRQPTEQTPPHLY